MDFRQNEKFSTVVLSSTITAASAVYYCYAWSMALSASSNLPTWGRCRRGLYRQRGAGRAYVWNRRRRRSAPDRSPSPSALLPTASSATALSAKQQPHNVYFGAGCFWHVQHEFVSAERSLRSRRDSELTSLAGYAGPGSQGGRRGSHLSSQFSGGGGLRQVGSRGGRGDEYSRGEGRWLLGGVY